MFENVRQKEIIVVQSFVHGFLNFSHQAGEDVLKKRD